VRGVKKVEQTTVTQKIPVMRQIYNQQCRGVDLANQYCNAYRYDHKQYKWWKPIFDEVLQITVSNMHIIHKHLSNTPLSRLDFHLRIIKFLIYEQPIERPLQEISHYPDWVPLKKLSLQGSEDLNVDNNLPSKKDYRLNCKAPDCKKKTDLHCVGCTKISFVCALCVPDCFKKYHELH